MPLIDTKSLKLNINRFLTRHKVQLDDAMDRATDVFEAVCYVAIAKRYQKLGYSTAVLNEQGNSFKFCLSTNAYPWNFSYLYCEQMIDGSKVEFELRHNVRVSGAWGSHSSRHTTPVFTADIVVVEANCIPDEKPASINRPHDFFIEQQHLITFAEAKKFQASPMLLASFHGMVHEIMPAFVGASGHRISSTFKLQKHILPVLFTADALTDGTRIVRDSFNTRGLNIVVLQNDTGKRLDYFVRRLKTL